MSKQREALELARAATPHDQLITELLDSRIPKTEREHAAAREIKRLREALAEPEPKPVVWIRHENEWVGLSPKERLPIETPRPDARNPLTDEQIDKIIASNVTITDKYLLEAVHMAIREVEAAHGIGGEE